MRVTPQTPQQHISSQRLPGKVFADATASAIWAALVTLDDGLQYQFLARLRVRLAVAERETPQATRIADAARSLNEAYSVLLAETTAAGTSQPSAPDLTESTYDGLRRTHPEYGWMAASTIRRTAGGAWDDALKHAHLDTVSDGAVVTRYLGPAFTWDEVGQALRDFRDHRAQRHAPRPEDFSLNDYVAWAKREDILRLPGRRPRSQGPFNTFEGFLRAKYAAFSGTGPPSSASPSAPRSGSVRPGDVYRYSYAQLKAAVDEVVARLGRSPLSGEFMRTQGVILREEAEQGLPERAVASYHTLIKRWKVWDAVLVACGHEPHRPVELDPETGRGIPGRRPHISDDDMLAGIVEAFERKGKPFNSRVYKDYVEDRCRVSDTGRRLATYPCIRGRYRGKSERPWKHACDLALPPG